LTGPPRVAARGSAVGSGHPLERLELVANARRLLELQVLGSSEHLQLERLDAVLAARGLDLFLGHLLDGVVVGRSAGGVDVHDGAFDGGWRDAVLGVVSGLEYPSAVGLVDGELHRGGHPIGIHDDLTIDIARGTAARLDERARAAQEAFLVGVEDGDQ
jgi:hypothetical protein